MGTEDEEGRQPAEPDSERFGAYLKEKVGRRKKFFY